MNLNRDFSTALCKWLSQFSEDMRLGFFLTALSIIYVAEKEMDTFLEIAIDKLSQVVNEKERRAFGVLEGIDGIKHKIIPLPLSDSGIYDRFIHKIGIESTLDRNIREKEY